MLLQPGNARDADESGVVPEEGIVDRRSRGENWEGVLADDAADVFEETAAEWDFVTAKVPGPAEDTRFCGRRREPEN